ncbi:U6 snRNA phosphodiesterase 1-like [Sycon ciliatum]|uniref:U6 snRNA phosphodiesterase 1-like n=1 Tax=Sycon ciliatum TaxID=27933 RepID=UPI0031F6C038
MSLVSYSSDSSSCSESEGGEPARPPAKKVCRASTSTGEAPLPLPSGLLECFNQTAHSDNPQKHGGRQRSFPHTKGNWATFVYIPCTDEFASWLEPVAPKLFGYVGEKRGSKPFTSNINDGLHLSLSRVVPIPHHLIKPLTAELGQRLNIFQRFHCQVAKPRVYCNDEKTRSFLSLSVVHGQEKLKLLLGIVDEVFVEFGLPKFYKEASFHVSIGWTLGELSPLTLKEEHDLHSLLQSRTSCAPPPLTVDGVVCKTGNKLHRFPLSG